MSLANYTLFCGPKVRFFPVSNVFEYSGLLLAGVIINAIMAVVASCSNAVVIYTISRTPSLQTPSNILILGLAIADLSVGIVAQPSYCLFKVFEFRRDADLYCFFGKVYTYSLLPLAVISFLTLSAITADRFLAVHLHLRYQDIITTKRVGIALGFIWIFSPCITVVVITFIHQMEAILTSVCVFLLIFSLNICFIVRVSLVIRRHSLQIQSQQSAQQPMNMVRFRKSAIVMFLVIGAFILCYIPYVVTIIMISLDGREDHGISYGISIALFISQILIMLNGILNPIIYCWRIEDIRAAAVLQLRKMWRRDVT